MTPPGPPPPAPDGDAILRFARRASAPLRERLEARAITPHLALVVVGAHPIAEHQATLYAREAKAWGVRVQQETLPQPASDSRLRRRLKALVRAKDPALHGVILLRPLPADLSLSRAREAIAPPQDVEGVHPETRGRLHLGSSAMACAQAAAVLLLLDTAGLDLAGAEVAVVAPRSSALQATAPLLLARGATVTLCPPDPPEPTDATRRADVLIVGNGHAASVDASWVTPGAFVVDAGVHSATDTTGTATNAPALVGDVNGEDLARVGAVATPVPGGLAAATVAAVLTNTLQAALGLPRLAEEGPLPLFER